MECWEINGPHIGWSSYNQHFRSPILIRASIQRGKKCIYRVACKGLCLYQSPIYSAIRMKYLDRLRTKSTRLEASILPHSLPCFCFSLTSLWPSTGTLKRRTFTSSTLTAVRTLRAPLYCLYYLKAP